MAKAVCVLIYIHEQICLCLFYLQQWRMHFFLPFKDNVFVLFHDSEIWRINDIYVLFIQFYSIISCITFLNTYDFISLSFVVYDAMYNIPPHIYQYFISSLKCLRHVKWWWYRNMLLFCICINRYLFLLFFIDKTKLTIVFLILQRF